MKEVNSEDSSVGVFWNLSAMLHIKDMVAQKRNEDQRARGREYDRSKSFRKTLREMQSDVS